MNPTAAVAGWRSRGRSFKLHGAGADTTTGDFTSYDARATYATASDDRVRARTNEPQALPGKGGGLYMPYTEDGTSVDIVLSSQVLEHVPSPQDYLREAHRVLKPAGTLLLSTHGYWMYHPDPTDFWRWTRDGLVRQIEAAGFTVQSVKGVMNLASTGLQLFQDGVVSAVPRLLRPVFCYLVNRTMALVDRLGSDASRDRDAAVFIVRAVKA